MYTYLCESQKFAWISSIVKDVRSIFGLLFILATFKTIFSHSDKIWRQRTRTAKMARKKQNIEWEMRNEWKKIVHQISLKRFIIYIMSFDWNMWTLKKKKSKNTEHKPFTLSKRILQSIRRSFGASFRFEICFVKIMAPEYRQFTFNFAFVI